ncbi:glycoside hydrolase family 97 catalytic domain-containing protein [Streptomyces sp. NBC_00453]|uniref:glycoside hydrolase family 97 catalytic domain-containing protein n=1 Tax=Streptomyces sp. NBC_00453 TaxID=2903653 RepID=UPI002E1E1BD0
MLWYHWQDLDTAAERDAEFTKITGWGVVGVKIDFMGSEAQVRHQWYDAALADTARYKLMVDLHGSRLSVGVHRTWPHVLTNEAVRGEEYAGGRNIGHVAALPFTRGLLGPADYSPMSFQQSNPNSDAAELALTVLLDSGIMLPGGRISDYQARPEAQRWLRMLPTVRDETKYVSGDPLTHGSSAPRPVTARARSELTLPSHRDSCETGAPSAVRTSSAHRPPPKSVPCAIFLCRSL